MRRRTLIAVLLVVATLGAYAALWGNDFVAYHDGVYITDNPYVSRGLSREGFVWAFNVGHAANWHPLTWLSHMLDVSLWGLDARGHHLTSLALHATSAVVLFFLFARSTQETGKSAFVAAVFALHPQHVESVAWVAERKDVLSTLLGLLAVAAWFGWVRRGGRGRYLAAVGLYALCLMAKPMLVTLPFLLLLLDLWPLRRLRRRAGTEPAVPALGALLLEKLPFFALAAASCALTIAAQSRGGSLAGIAGLPLSFRLGHAACTYLTYVLEALWPVRLAVFHPYPLGAMSVTKVAFCTLCLAAATTAAVTSARRRPWLAVGWLWWLGTLAPVIGIVQVGEQSRADRYVYLPLVGLAILVAWGVGEIAEKQPGGRVVARALALAAIAFWMGLTFAHVGFWRDEETLFRRAADVTERNYLAHGRIADALEQKGRIDEALIEYRAALEDNPNDAGGHNELGRLLEKQGQLEAAIASYRRALEIDPSAVVPRGNLASALDASGRSQEALAHFEEALRLQPENAGTRNGYGVALAQNRRFQEALEQFGEATRCNPDFGDAWINRGITLANLGRVSEAVLSLRRGLELRPDRMDAQGVLEKLQRELADTGPAPR